MRATGPDPVSAEQLGIDSGISIESYGENRRGSTRSPAGSLPFAIDVAIRGVAPILFHRFDCDSVEAKARPPKNSATKTTDDIESYVYRDELSRLCLPAVALHGALVESSKFNKDPRNPRASCRDLVKAGLLVEPHLVPFLPERTAWDFLDRRAVTVNRGRVTRIRPALQKDWRLEFQIHSLVPEFLTRELIYELLVRAGGLVGVGDFRPSFGRFLFERFEVGPK